MGFLDRLFGRKKADKESGTPPAIPSKPQAAGSGDRINGVYLYVVATTPVNAATADQMRTYALEQLKADTTFRQIMSQVEQNRVPLVKGHGTASSSGQFTAAFEKWLQTKGTSLDRAKNVMGKKLFVFGGDAQNPADGSKFGWGLLGCFR